MAEILNKYTESTKNTFIYIFLALIFIIISAFTPNINQNKFRFIVFKLIIIIFIIYSIFIIVSNTLPIIKDKNIQLLASSKNGIKKKIIYNTILVVFLLILIWYSCMMSF